MPEIIITGQNNITKEFEKQINKLGYEVFVISDINDLNLHHFNDVLAIIDFNNIIYEDDDLKLLRHNTVDLTKILDVAHEQKAPYIFLYKWDTIYNANNSVNIAIEIINKYQQISNITPSFVEVGNIYGEDLLLDDVLRETLYSLTRGQEIFIHDDTFLLRPIYVSDFIDGLAKIIEESKKSAPLKKYSLTSETAITYIEYVHFIKSLTSLDTKITYSKADLSSLFVNTDFAVFYPKDWQPKITLKEGLLRVLQKYGISTIVDKKQNELLSSNSTDIESISTSRLNKTEQLLEMQRILQRKLEENRRKYEELLKYQLLQTKPDIDITWQKQSQHNKEVEDKEEDYDTSISTTEETGSIWLNIDKSTNAQNGDSLAVEKGEKHAEHNNFSNNKIPKIKIISSRELKENQKKDARKTHSSTISEDGLTTQSDETHKLAHKPKTDDNYKPLPIHNIETEEDYSHLDLYSQSPKAKRREKNNHPYELAHFLEQKSGTDETQYDKHLEETISEATFYNTDSTDSNKEDLDNFDQGYENHTEITYDTPEALTNMKTFFSAKRIIVFLSLVLAILLAIPYAYAGFNLYNGFKHLDSAQESFSAFDLDKTKEESELALQYLNKIGGIPPIVNYTKPITKLDANAIQTILSLAKTKAKIFNNLSNSQYLSYLTSNNADNNVLGATTIIQQDENLSKTIEEINLIRKDLNDLQNSKNVPSNLLDRFKINDDDYEKLNKIYRLSTVWNLLVGMGKPKKYLLVVVDNNELRATGGIIDGFGILNIANGNLYLKEIKKPYDINKTLENSEIVQAPPLPLRNAFKYNQYNFTDTTWDPDFEDNAKTMLKIYEYVEDESVDGVISIDSNAVKNLLEITEPIEMPSYQTSVTIDNFDEQMLLHRSEDNSTAEFYSQLYTRILTNALNKVNWIKYGDNYSQNLYKTIYKDLETKHIIMYAKNTKVQQALKQNNWAGTIHSGQDDYLYVVDSNISNNKVNKFIKRDIEYKAYKPGKDNIFKREVTLTYTNTAESDEWPLGDYTNHIRIIVPRDAFLNSAKLIEANKEKNITRKIIVSPYKNKAIYEANIFVPLGKEVKLKLEYESAEKYFEDGEINAYFQKQPGTLSNSLNIIIAYPFGMNKNTLPDGFKIENNHIIKRDNLKFDRIYNITL